MAGEHHIFSDKPQIISLRLTNYIVKVITEGKGLTSWLLFVMFIVILLLSHLVAWDR